MYETILVPSDGSPEAERAAGHAIELAGHFDATVHGLFVAESDDEPTERGERALDELRARAEERGVAVETSVREGDPAAAVVDAVEDVGADLVVMGTHGRSGVERILIGSVAERVVRTSPIPVTTVGLNDDGQSVTTAERARQIAREQLEIAGHAEADVEAPSRQRSAWVVHARDGDTEFNVHINSASGRARLVQLS